MLVWKILSNIDGEKLAELMMRFGLGVSISEAYEIKKIDSDFFEEL